MDCSTRMKYIRILEKMNDHPEKSRRLGLIDKSYVRKGTETFRRGDQS